MEVSLSDLGPLLGHRWVEGDEASWLSIDYARWASPVGPWLARPQ
jgi:hypothetical protein